MILSTISLANESETPQAVRNKAQAVSAAEEWRAKMSTARKALPTGIGQQDVIQYVTEKYPALDSLLFATRWRNAWLGRVADPEITGAVEAAAIHFKARQQETASRLKRQGLNKAKK